MPNHPSSADVRPDTRVPSAADARKPASSGDTISTRRLARTRELWSHYYGRPVSEEEARRILADTDPFAPLRTPAYPALRALETVS